MSEGQRIFYSHNFNSLERKTKPVRWLAAATIDWALIFFAAYVAYEAFYLMRNLTFSFDSVLLFVSVFVFAWLVIGSRQHALSILAHDGAHGLVTLNNASNDFLTHAFAFWPLGITLPTYRSFHFTHHQHLATSRDPELFHKALAAPYYDLPISSTNTLRYYTFRDLALCSLKEIMGLFVVLGKPQKITHLIPIILWWLTIGMGIFFLNKDFLWFFLGLWFFSLGTSFWASFRLRVLTEHMGTADTHTIRASCVEQMLFLPHNTWYHAEHHFDTNVSAFLLPKIRATNTHGIPEKTVDELFASYTAYPKIPSGTALSPK